MDFKRILANQRDELNNLDLSSLVTRQEEKQINLESKLAQVVIGVRRSGKSTLCQKVLLESNVQFGYVNFDDENFYDLKPEQLDEILETLYRIHGPLDHFFFDEIQNVKKVWPLFVNRLLRQGKHLIITGSNANLLSGELATHLTGRYHRIENFPFSFLEYCKRGQVDTTTYSTLASGLRQRALDEYLVRGGMPELISENERGSYIKSLIESIVKKDICKRHNIKGIEGVKKLINLTLDLIGQELTTNSLAKKIEMSQPTVASYLAYLKEAYILREVPLFSFKNIDRQRTRKYYAVDVSFMVNHDYALGSAGLGWRLENVIAIELMRRVNPESDQIFYLKENKQYEVDFVIVRSGHIDELIQVTYDFKDPSTKQYKRELLGLVRGSEVTKCNNLTLIIMEGETREVTIEGKTISIIRASDWLTKL